MNTSPLPVLYYYFYELLPHAPLNAKSGHECRPGILLRSAEGGVACLQPWTELGDHSLRDEIQALRNGSPLPLGRRALDCIHADAQARKELRSLFSPEVSIPESHATLRAGIGEEELLSLHVRGFSTGKYKATRNLTKIAEDLARFSAILPEWRWRIDFNGILTPDEFLEVAPLLQGISGNKIDFFEDPTPFDEALWLSWQSKGIPIAVDWLPSGYTPSSPLPLKVWKPASEVVNLSDASRWVVTSYMDHPIGQTWAAYEASMLQLLNTSVDICGLATQDLYHPSAFSERLGPASPKFTPPCGTGLGFDDLLNTLPWKKLE